MSVAAVPDRLKLGLLAPGLALAGAVALASTLLAPAVRSLSQGRVSLPDMVVALLIGIALHPLAARPLFQPGLSFAVKRVLRWAIGLLGLRIALGDIIGLGFGTAALVVLSMAATVSFTVWFAGRVGREAGFGALAGAANAVCGASATLATATVVPSYPGKNADIAFTVVMANAMSTVVMLAYPALALWIGLDERQTGILLGAAIHDMAQVVGAGYAVSDDVGNTAVVVKLFRVFLLLPVVLLIGHWLARRATMPDGSTPDVPIPVFAVVFLALCLVNTLMLAMPVLSEAVRFPAIAAVLSEAARWGLLIAIAALGLGTSLKALFSIGWRHVLVFTAATVFILLFVLGALALLV